MTLGVVLCLLNFLISNREAQAGTTIDLHIMLSTIPPLVMQNDAGKSGALWDLAQELEVRLNRTNTELISLRINTQILPWKRAYDRLQKSTNVIMLQMARTNTREQQFHWIAKTGNLSFAFISVKEPAIDSLSDALLKESIAVYRGSRLELFLKQKNFNSNLRPTNNSQMSARLLEAGRVETWYASVQEALWLHKLGVLKSSPVIGKPIFSTPIWAVTSLTTDPKAIERIKATLKNIESDGRLQEIFSRYGLDSIKSSQLTQ